MKRQIKFRRWHKGLLDMRYSESLSDFFEMVERYRDQYEIMQFTGLKDKNGKEIYEGDIIDNDVARWDVIFNTGCFCARIAGHVPKEGDMFIALRAIKGAKKIGDIFETPELLK